MVWSHIQDTPGSGSVDSKSSNVTTFTGTAFGSANTVGNIVQVWTWGEWEISTGTLSVTDNGTTSNTYTRLYEGNNGGTLGSWTVGWAAVIKNLPSSGNLRITITSTTNSVFAICASEFSGGGNTRDGSGLSNIGTSASPSAGSAVSVLSNDLLVASFNCNTAGFTINNSPTNLTIVGTGPNISGLLGNGGYYIVPGMINQAVTWSLSASKTWAAGAALLEAAVFNFSGAGNNIDPSFLDTGFFRSNTGIKIRNRLKNECGEDYYDLLMRINKERGSSIRRRKSFSLV